MQTDIHPSVPDRPQTIPRAYAGRWIAWSEDGLRIVAVGDSFEACEILAIGQGFSPEHVAIDKVPLGRNSRDEAEA